MTPRPRWSTPLASILLATLALMVTAAAAAAAESPGDAPATPEPTTLTLSVEAPPKADLPHRIKAVLATASGAPVNEATVRFYVQTDLLGGRSAALDEASTDATGSARIPIEPTRSTLDVRATYGGDDATEPSDVVTTLTFPDDAIVTNELEHETHSLLAPVRDVMPPAIAALVAFLWVLLIGLAVHTARAIRRQGDAAASHT